jgi:hypothetical protein
MHGLLKLAARLGLIFLMLLSFALSLGYTEKLRTMGSITMLYLETPLTAGELLKLHNEENTQEFPLDFSGWFQKDGEELYNPEFNRRSNANVVYLSGNSSLVLESAVPLLAGDTRGCLISGDLAYDLFGSTAVTGYSLTIADKEFTVRGILTDGTSTLAIPIPSEENKGTTGNNSDKSIQNTAPQSSSEQPALIKALAVDTGGLDKKERERAISRFTEQHQLTAESVDYDIFKNLAGLFAALLPVIVTAIVFTAFVKKAKAVRSKPFIFIMVSAGAALSLVAALFISSAHPEIPQHLIPNRWSDFEFWQRFYKDFTENCTQILYILKGEPEDRYFASMMKGIGFGLLAVILFWLTNIGMKLNTDLKCFGFLAASLVMEYLVLVTVNRYGLLPGNIVVIWLLYPYFLIGKYITK